MGEITPETTLQEINEHYDPGKMCWLNYVYADGRIVNVPHNEEHIPNDLDDMIRNKLPDPFLASRLVLAETQETLADVVAAISSHGLVPVRMEPYNVAAEHQRKYAEACGLL
jgi:hypothetical protein